MVQHAGSGRRAFAALFALLLPTLVFSCSRGGEPQDAHESQPAGDASAGERKDARPEEPAMSPPADPAALLDPTRLDERAPDRFTVRIETTKGDLLLDVDRSWSPHGADRFYNLVVHGFYDGCKFFRVIDGFVAQVGIHPDPKVSARWRNATIPDDPRRPDVSNVRGTVAFATAGPNTRTTQIFFNLVDNSRLDAMGFTPFGKVRNPEVLDRLFSGYGEGPPMGRGPDQSRIQAEGNAYLEREFPKLDAIVRARIVEE